MNFEIDTLPMMEAPGFNFADVNAMQLPIQHSAQISPISNRPSRYRSLSLSEVAGGFCRLEVSIPSIITTDLPELTAKADHALKCGVPPSMADGCCGGTYFLRDATSQFICVVFKPADEEPFAPNNPHLVGKHAGKFNKSYKGNILPGFGLYRELVAYALDSGRAGVPATQLAKVYHNSFRTTEKSSHDYKIGSVQSYVRDIECCAEDMGPGMMNSDDIQRVAVLDIRLCNLDRHPGNLLVCHTKSHLVQEDTEIKSSVVNRDPLLPRPDAIFQSFSENDISKSCPADVESYLLSSSNKMYAHLKEEVGCNIRESSQSPSPRAVHDNGTSPRTSDTASGDAEGGKLRLVPIDHGYCLPHVLHLSETNFAWLYWPQATAPVSEELRTYILNLDTDKDCDTVRHLVGAAISDTYLLTLRVCTMLLKIGVQEGLTLRSIGELMSPPPMCGGADDTPSPLQLAVYGAIHSVVTMRSPLASSSYDDTYNIISPTRTLSSSRMKHSPSESSLIDMDIISLNSPSRSHTGKSSDKGATLCHDDCNMTAPATFNSLNAGKCYADIAETEAETLAVPCSGSACSEADLQMAMCINGGSTLLDAFSAAITALVMSKIIA